MARKDKNKWIKDNFKADEPAGARERWKRVTNTKKGFASRPASLRNSLGIMAPLEERAQIFATFLADKVWSHTDIKPPP